MWTRLDDGLLDHRKMLEAARLLGGTDARARVLGWYTASLLYASKHLTDGKLTTAIVDELRIPAAGVRALVSVGLWRIVDKRKGLFVVNDYLEYNTPAADVLARRKRDAARKRRGNGHTASQ